MKFNIKNRPRCENCPSGDCQTRCPIRDDWLSLFAEELREMLQALNESFGQSYEVDRIILEKTDLLKEILGESE